MLVVTLNRLLLQKHALFCLLPFENADGKSQILDLEEAEGLDNVTSSQHCRGSDGLESSQSKGFVLCFILSRLGSARKSNSDVRDRRSISVGSTNFSN